MREDNLLAWPDEMVQNHLQVKQITYLACFFIDGDRYVSRPRILCVSLRRDARPFVLDILAFTLIIFASLNVICHDDDVL